MADWRVRDYCVEDCSCWVCCYMIDCDWVSYYVLCYNCCLITYVYYCNLVNYLFDNYRFFLSNQRLFQTIHFDCSFYYINQLS